MVKRKESVNELGIDRGNPKVFIISLIVGLIILAVIWATLTEIMGMQVGLFAKGLILLAVLDFLWRRIIEPISGKTVELLHNISMGKSIKQSIDEGIPIDEEEREKLKKEQEEKAKKEELKAKTT